jgi:hypothetical protein
VSEPGWGDYADCGSGTRSAATLNPVFDPTIGEFGGFTGEFSNGDPFVFVGANGDELTCHCGRTEECGPIR